MGYIEIWSTLERALVQRAERQCWRGLECFFRVRLCVKKCREKQRGNVRHSKKCTRKKFIIEELPNSSETEDMRKIW